MSDTSWLEIDLDQLAANLEALRCLVGRSVKICAVVKADAYGLGAASIARCLEDSGVDMLAVYSQAQAAQIIEEGVSCPLLLLGPLRQLEHDRLRGCAAVGQLHLSIHDALQMKQVEHIGRSLGRVLPVHLYLDTGMSRSGLDESQLGTLLGQRAQFEHLRLTGVYTHFADADNDPSFTAQQMQRLERVIDRLPQPVRDSLIIHAANTFAAHLDRRYHRSMVRIGLGCYGYGPLLMKDPTVLADTQRVRPIVRWLSQITHVAVFPAGATVGYQRTHRLARRSVLATVPVGFGDGYPAALSGRGEVCLVSGPDTYVAPVLGRVGMDQIVIDLTDVPRTGSRLGTRVELLSNKEDSPCALHRLAQRSGTSCYELLSQISGRLERRYIGQRSQSARHS